MTVLSALQSASIRLVGTRPTEFMTATDGIEIELADLAKEAALDIAKKHDWRALTALGTLSGDGSTVDFSLPADFGRLPKKSAVWSTEWDGMYFEPARDLDHWYYLKQLLTPGSPGYWMMLSGYMSIFPAMDSGETAQFYYISKNLALSSASAVKETFTADTDTFRLPERLLTLAVIWRWRQQKRLEYAEDMQNFEIALSEEIRADGGKRIISVGRRTKPNDAVYSFPGVITP